MKRIFALALLLVPGYLIAQEITLRSGLQITHSVKIKKNTYKLNPGDSLYNPLIIVTGNNITVDFNGAELTGSNDKTFPNEFYGLAVLVKGENIVIKNAFIRGYKVAILATGCKGLQIENCDLSYNYRQKLHSNRLREAVSDWMSFHHNDNREWLRYGAGIYLEDCSNTEIKGNKITGSQCALLMTRCNDGLIVNNDFSYNSGLGIGMYRSSRNKVMNNRLVFNVRGYSDGIFNRGQDSAGILVFEQCNENIFAYNNVTYGGDGFFLWAGQTTMDKGTGGCNDNTLYKNDFSYAPTNGVELTFSRNKVKDNIINECDNGIWGGYSFNTEISGNEIRNNRTGIAIEHGQDNELLWNKFNGNKTAINLWANRIEPSSWGYPKKRDTRSRNYWLIGNEFSNNTKLLKVTNTDTLWVCKLPDSLKKYLAFDSTVKATMVTECDLSAPEGYFKKFKALDDELTIYRKTFDPFLTTISDPGRKQIRVTEWGPYDFRYPIIWLKDEDSSGRITFEILGPKSGKWTVLSAIGLKQVEADEGTFPASFTAVRTSKDIGVYAEYTGEAFTDQLGHKVSKGQPYAFAYRDLDPGVQWKVDWYKWDTAHDPNKNYAAFKTIYSDTSIMSVNTSSIDYTWWGAIGKHLPADSFATVATGSGIFKPGKYSLEVTADDLVKVFIDGKLVIDFWDAKKYINDEDAQHDVIVELNGKHDIRIEHVENGGYATLQVVWRRLE